jgi:UTP--glucose-1-phosphate uridylyltransferase
MSTFTPFAEKMESAGVSAAAVNAFSRCYEALVSNHSGMIPETDILPADQVEDWRDITASTPAADKDLISRCVCIKLNGGLGTSMGLQKAKSLLKVKGEDTFLDLIVRQVKHLRSLSGTPVRLLLMNSFSTSADTLAYLEKYAADGFADPAQVELMQNRVPKILADGLSPASCPEQPELEWCPPGHGDLFSTIWESGLLDVLEERGFKYLFISNSDNLGARPSRTLAQHFENTGAPFMAEVAIRTKADRKGGHIVRDKATGRLILREMSQVHPDDKEAAQDITKHPYFNTNSIWVRIDALKDKLAECDGVLPLPVIRNKKTVNPTDPDSEQVIQLETAMGAAIGLFNGSICVQVDRMRFLPVKTTNDLFIMRSDRFHLTDTYEMEDGNYIFPNVELDPRYYKNIHDFDERFPYAVPSLAAANSVSIQGDWTFGRDVMMFADAKLEDKGKPSYVPNGEYVGPQGIEPDDWV